jgi:hypothetical protein
MLTSNAKLQSPLPTWFHTPRLLLALTVGTVCWTQASATLLVPAAGDPAMFVLDSEHVSDDPTQQPVRRACDGWFGNLPQVDLGCGGELLADNAGDASDQPAAVANAADLRQAAETAPTVPPSATGWGLGIPDVNEGRDDAVHTITQQLTRATHPQRAIATNATETRVSMRRSLVTGIGGTLAAAAAVGLVLLARRSSRRVLRAWRNAGRKFDAMALGVRRVVTVEEIDPCETLSPTSLRRRGWSPECMEKLLGRPDYAVVDPQGLREPLILLSRSRVEMLEQDETFRRYQTKRMVQAKTADMQIDKWVALEHAADIRQSPI